MGLSLGSADPLDVEHLSRLRRLAARIEPAYDKLSEEAKRELLLKLLQEPRSLRVRNVAYSPLVEGELAIFEAARQLRQDFGPNAIRHYIICSTSRRCCCCRRNAA